MSARPLPIIVADHGGRAVVNCGPCRLCCIGELIIVGEHERRAYKVRRIGDIWAIKHKDNGECVYLGPDGCTIWDRAPTICRVFDCIDHVRTNRDQASDEMKLAAFRAKKRGPIERT